MRSRCRSSPPAASAISIIWSRASATAMPPPCSRPRSFISASFRCATPRSTWPRRACRCGSTRDRLSPPRRRGAKKPPRNVELMPMAQSFTLNDLEKRVQARALASAEESYTRKLLDRGVAQCAKKLGEEAVEAAIAAVGEDRQRMIGEAADVLYHLLVVLHARGIALAEVEAELGARTRQSGLDEKAARKRG